MLLNKQNMCEICAFEEQKKFIIVLSITEKGDNMKYFNQEEQEYNRFKIKLASKANEVQKEYNELSDKNKRRIDADIRRFLWTNIVFRKRF